jgi:hypothetical protein
METLEFREIVPVSIDSTENPLRFGANVKVPISQQVCRKRPSPEKSTGLQQMNKS